jgi:hypothetical protein
LSAPTSTHDHWSAHLVRHDVRASGATDADEFQAKAMNNKRVKEPALNGQPAKTKLARRSRQRHDQAAADDRRLDAELADSFPGSDPPSILRRGNP